MSHRAIVAIQTDADTYDIHYSNNGARGLNLTPLLQEYLAGKTTDLEAVAGGDTNQVPQLEKWNALDDIDSEMNYVSGQDDNAINTEPRASGVPLDRIGMPFEYDDIEAFYLVRNGRVKTYIPVWLEPNVIRPWRENFRVEVYRSGKLADNPQEMLEDILETDPLRVIDGELFSGKEWTNDTITWDVVLRNHEAIYALHRRTTNADEYVEEMVDDEGRDDSAPDDSSDPTADLPLDEEALEASGLTGADTTAGFLTTGSHVILVAGPNDRQVTPNPMARGILVEIPNGNTARLSNVRDTANELRMEAGTRLNSPADPPTDDDLSEEMQELIKEAIREFNGDIAPFSPPPFGQIAEKVANSVQ